LVPLFGYPRLVAEKKMSVNKKKPLESLENNIGGVGGRANA
jgi:hypothetical protein